MPLHFICISTKVVIDAFWMNLYFYGSWDWCILDLVFSYSSVGFVAGPPSTSPSQETWTVSLRLLAFAFFLKYISQNSILKISQILEFAHSDSEECNYQNIFSQSNSKNTFLKKSTSRDENLLNLDFMTFPCFQYPISHNTSRASQMTNTLRQRRFLGG